MEEEWSSPPKWAERMLSWFCSEKHLDILLGDLYELYEYRLETKGKFWARLHYAKDAFDMLRPFALKRTTTIKAFQGLQNSIIMFKNNIKIGWRNILRYKGYSAINITGLALGLACCMILYRYVTDELSYDKFHANADDIYRIVFSTEKDKSPSNANGSLGPGSTLALDLPEVASSSRVLRTGSGGRTVVLFEEKSFYEEQFFFADSSILEVFTFPLLRGDKKTALKRPNTVVITESVAKKYFGEEDPMGKLIDAYPNSDGVKMQFEVTGVAQDVPSNSHIHFGFFASYHSQKGDWLDSWGGFWQAYTYVRLNQGVDGKIFNEKISDYSAKFLGEEPWYTLSAQSILDIHLNSNLKSEIETTSNITKVYVFSAVGMLILVIACINFLTLSTAKSSRRAKEVGVRKTFGAHRVQLFSQFISEAMLHGTLATFLAIWLVVLALPFVNDLTGKTLALVMGGNWLELAVMVVSSVLIVAFMAGLYPAIFLSSFSPITALRSVVTGKGSTGVMRRVLVAFQFSVSIILIVGSLVVRQQMKLVRTESLSENGEQEVILQLNNQLKENLSAFENVVKQNPAVQHMSGASRVPTKGSSTNCFRFREDGTGACAYAYYTDFDYPETMEYTLVTGRFFDKSIPTDADGAFVISEGVLGPFGLGTAEEAIGKKFGHGDYPNGRVIGVVEDFHIYSLHTQKEASYMVIAPKERYSFMAIRVAPTDLNATLDHIGKAWSQFSTEAPFDYFFLDEAFQRLHDEDLKTGKVVSILTLLAILIAATGLFGLASFTSEQRAKEIGIRKVLGAGITSVLILMSKSYLILILVASVIGIPVSYWLMSKWLEGFVYRISFNPLIFLVAILTVGIIVAFSIGYQSIKAATTNPVKSLRSE